MYALRKIVIWGTTREGEQANSKDIKYTRELTCLHIFSSTLYQLLLFGFLGLCVTPCAFVLVVELGPLPVRQPTVPSKDNNGLCRCAIKVARLALMARLMFCRSQPLPFLLLLPLTAPALVSCFCRLCSRKAPAIQAHRWGSVWLACLDCLFCVHSTVHACGTSSAAWPS